MPSKAKPSILQLAGLAAAVGSSVKSKTGATASPGSTTKTLTQIVDGYFKKYGRVPKINYSPDDLRYVRAVAVRELLRGDTDAYKSYLLEVADKFGVDVNEALQYIIANPGYIKTLTSQEDLKGNVLESLTDFVHDTLLIPINAAAETIGDTIKAFLKQLVPVVIVVAVLYLAFKYANKKVS